MPGMNFSTAVPALVNCAVPSRWMSVQYATEASQKETWPTVTGFPPAVTVAVSDTTLPDATEPPDGNVVPPEVSASVVVVDAGNAQAGRAPPQKTIIISAEMCNDRPNRFIFRVNLQLLLLRT
jgi:hypothetical protein